MSKPVTRLGDLCNGHDSCPPRPSTSASENVFVNGIGAHRKNDTWAEHCSHTSVLESGSPSVYVNGRALGRVGDPIACGSVVAEGSDNVFSG